MTAFWHKTCTVADLCSQIARWQHRVTSLGTWLSQFRTAPTTSLTERPYAISNVIIPKSTKKVYHRDSDSRKHSI